MGIGLILGMRHGADPDHLAAIDGLTRLRPRPANGVWFALGHGLVVTVLAAGVGHVIAGRLGWIGPWTLILIGVVNLWRVLRRSAAPAVQKRPIVAQPFLLGMLLAAGFETASQLSALVLAGRTNAWLLGTAFGLGMLLIDGLDGYLASSTQQRALAGYVKAQAASRFLGILVVLYSFGLGACELAGLNLDGMALPLGLCLLSVILAMRIWTRVQPGSTLLPDVVLAAAGEEQ